METKRHGFAWFIALMTLLGLIGLALLIFGAAVEGAPRFLPDGTVIARCFAHG